MSNQQQQSEELDTQQQLENILEAHGNNISPLLNSTSRDVPTWQPDEDANACPICNHGFTFFFRKHHCRKCGRIICNECSNKFTTYLSNTYVVSPQSQIFLESPHVPHRTCNDCAEELEMIRSALRDNNSQHLDIATSNNNNHGSSPTNNNIIKILPYRMTTREVHGSSSLLNVGTSTNNPSYPSSDLGGIVIPASANSNNNTSQSHQQDEDDHLCPVCAVDLTSFPEQQKESHINLCLENLEFSGSPETKRVSNRMLVYTIAPDTKVENLNLNEDNECVICFEEFKPGDKVGRLECLCCFHYKCIREWFNRKGNNECPVHTIHTD